MRTRIRPVDLVDIFVYLVVLGTFTQLFPEVISETFLASLITAILLKIVLGDAVYLGGFWSVTLLVVVLMLGRVGVRAILGSAADTSTQKKTPTRITRVRVQVWALPGSNR